MIEAKWIRRVRSVFFSGYSNASKGYRLYNPETKKLIIRRDVVFMSQANKIGMRSL